MPRNDINNQAQILWRQTHAEIRRERARALNLPEPPRENTPSTSSTATLTASRTQLPTPLKSLRNAPPTPDQLAFLAQWGKSTAWKPRNYSEADNAIQLIQSSKRYQRALKASATAPHGVTVAKPAVALDVPAIKPAATTDSPSQRTRDNPAPNQPGETATAKATPPAGSTPEDFSAQHTKSLALSSLTTGVLTQSGVFNPGRDADEPTNGNPHKYQ